MSKHMKRLASPRRWTIPKKEHKWALKPLAGPHATDASLPLGIVLRDYLGVADTAREAKRIAGNRDVLVDGKPATDVKHGVGYMDVVSLPKMEEHYRVLLDTRGRLVLAPTGEQAAQWKLSRIEDKTVIKGGLFQLNMHDGRNVVMKTDDYKTGDVLKLRIPDQKVMQHYPMTEGASAMITGGSHAGSIANVDTHEVTRNPKPNLVHLRKGDLEFTTISPYVFVVGGETPEIKLPENVEVVI